MKNSTLQQLLKDFPDNADVSIRIGILKKDAVIVKNVYVENHLERSQDDIPRLCDVPVVVIDVDF